MMLNKSDLATGTTLHNMAGTKESLKEAQLNTSWPIAPSYLPELPQSQKKPRKKYVEPNPNDYSEYRTYITAYTQYLRDINRPIGALRDYNVAIKHLYRTRAYYTRIIAELREYNKTHNKYSKDWQEELSFVYTLPMKEQHKILTAFHNYLVRIKENPKNYSTPSGSDPTISKSSYIVPLYPSHGGGTNTHLEMDIPPDIELPH